MRSRRTACGAAAGDGGCIRRLACNAPRRADACGGRPMNWLLVAILGYVLVQFAIGAWVSRRMASETDYILAGRRLGVGPGHLLGVCHLLRRRGHRGLRRRGLREGPDRRAGRPRRLRGRHHPRRPVLRAGACGARGLTTFADLFRQRYSPGVERLVVIVLLPGSVIWAAAQVRAFGQVMSANSGMGLVAAITLAAVLVAAYSVVGGLLADAVTDVIQGVAVVVGPGHPGRHRRRARRRRLRRAWPRVEPEQLAALARRGRLARHARAARHPDLRHDRGGGADLALPRRAHGRGRRPRHGARRRDLSADRPDPGVPRADGPAASAATFRIRSRSCRGWRRSILPGVLYVAFVGAIISAILSVVHAALHAPASQISHNIVVRLVPGLTDRGKLWSVRLTVMALSIVAYLLSRHFAAHSRIWSRRRRPSAAPACSSRRCLRCSRASAGPPAPTSRWRRACWCGPAASMRLGWPRPICSGCWRPLVGYVGVALLELARK